MSSSSDDTLEKNGKEWGGWSGKTYERGAITYETYLLTVSLGGRQLTHSLDRRIWLCHLA